MLLLTAFAAMIATTFIHHLGLAQAIAEVVKKVTDCGQCFTFWATLAGLLYSGGNIITSTLLAIIMAYSYNWFVLLLLLLQRIFTNLYGKKTEQQRNKTTNKDE